MQAITNGCTHWCPKFTQEPGGNEVWERTQGRNRLLCRLTRMNARSDAQNSHKACRNGVGRVHRDTGAVGLTARGAGRQRRAKEGAAPGAGHGCGGCGRQRKRARLGLL